MQDYLMYKSADNLLFHCYVINLPYSSITTTNNYIDVIYFSDVYRKHCNSINESKDFDRLLVVNYFGSSIFDIVSCNEYILLVFDNNLTLFFQTRTGYIVIIFDFLVQVRPIMTNILLFIVAFIYAF